MTSRRYTGPNAAVNRGEVIGGFDRVVQQKKGAALGGPCQIPLLITVAAWAATGGSSLDVDVGDVVDGATGQHEIAVWCRDHMPHDTTA